MKGLENHHHQSRPCDRRQDSKHRETPDEGSKDGNKKKTNKRHFSQSLCYSSATTNK